MLAGSRERTKNAPNTACYTGFLRNPFPWRNRPEGGSRTGEGGGCRAEAHSANAVGSEAAAAERGRYRLLAALQREARFVDFIQENLTGYNDAQNLGPRARDVHRDCGKVLQRMFEIHPASDAEEDSPVEVPEGFDAGRFRLVGNVVGEPPFTGKMTHHGWIAQKCELPTWAGSNDAAKVIAPIEVELK